MPLPRKLLLVILPLLIVAIFFIVEYQSGVRPRLALSKILWKLDPHHELRTAIFGDPSEEYIKLRLINKEERITFPTTEKGTLYFREKWKFRPSSISGNIGKALVEDIDKDGIPDVFFGSNSSKVYRLNGITGEKVWEYTLPYGVTSSIANFLGDLDNDGTKEFVFGNTISFPVRVYALRTRKNVKNRVFWTRKVGGDFFYGGLNYFRTPSGDVRVVTGTRDAPYSRGSINILDGFGKSVVPEISGFDVCNNRPAFFDVNNDGTLDVLMGSLDIYGTKYGRAVTTIDSLTGDIIWSTPVGADTGWVNFLILDIDGNGEKEILVPIDKHMGVGPEIGKILILSTKGKIKGEIKGGYDYIASFSAHNGNMTILYDKHIQKGASNPVIKRRRLFRLKRLISRNLKTRAINYELPLVSSSIVSVLDLNDDYTPEILATLKIDGTLALLVLNAYTGKLESVYKLNSKEEVKFKHREEELSNLLEESFRKGFSEYLMTLKKFEKMQEDFESARENMKLEDKVRLIGLVNASENALTLTELGLEKTQKQVTEKLLPKFKLSEAKGKVRQAQKNLRSSKAKLATGMKLPIEDLYERRALKKEVDVFQNEQIAFFKNFESITLLEGLFNLPLPEAYRGILLMVLNDRISRGLRSSVLADIDGDGHWELIGMENPYIKLTIGTSDPKKGFHSAYDLPFPVLKGHDTNNTHTAFQANLFKPRG